MREAVMYGAAIPISFWQANYEIYRVDRKDESTLKDGTTYIATVKYGKVDFAKPGS